MTIPHPSYPGRNPIHFILSKSDAEAVPTEILDVHWALGNRDIFNDDEIGDALRLALEKDPLVQADQIRVNVRNRVVTLEGYVVTKEEMKMAEWDAWHLFGVEEVVNNIEVQK